MQPNELKRKDHPETKEEPVKISKIEDVLSENDHKRLFAQEKVTPYRVIDLRQQVEKDTQITKLKKELEDMKENSLKMEQKYNQTDKILTNVRENHINELKLRDKKILELARLTDIQLKQISEWNCKILQLEDYISKMHKIIDDFRK